VGKLLTLGSPKEDRHWVFRRFSAERRRELTQHLFDELDRQEDEPAEIRRRLEMVQRAKRAVALVDEYGKLRNELIDATPSWFHWLVPPPFRPALSSEQHSREMRELRWRLSRLASRHATDELHDRIDRVLEELADLRARILETDPPPESLHDEVERQRRAAARTRAKELFQRLIAIRQECFTLIRESEGIAQEAALDRLLEGCTSDGSGRLPLFM